jgi:hypothetical protein
MPGWTQTQIDAIKNGCYVADLVKITFLARDNQAAETYYLTNSGVDFNFRDHTGVSRLYTGEGLILNMPRVNQTSNFGRKTVDLAFSGLSATFTNSVQDGRYAFAQVELSKAILTESEPYTQIGNAVLHYKGHVVRAHSDHDLNDALVTFQVSHYLYDRESKRTLSTNYDSYRAYLLDNNLAQYEKGDYSHLKTIDQNLAYMWGE